MPLDPRRADMLTASNFAAAAGICPYKSRQKLWRELSGLEPPFEGNEATQWGTDHEADNIHAYECATGEIVTSGGDGQKFVIHPNIPWLGCTPDGFAGWGMVEAKSPYSGKVNGPDYYMPQLQGQLEICNRPWVDLSVWTPEQHVITRVHRSDEYWCWLFPLLEEFWQHVQDGTEPKRRKKPTPPPLELAA